MALLDRELQQLGTRIDDACDRSDADELLRLAAECETTRERANGGERVLVLYFEANAYQDRHRILSADPAYAWSMSAALPFPVAAAKA